MANIMSPSISYSKPSVNRQVFLLGAVLNLGYLAACIDQSSRVYLFQQAQCLTYYKAHDTTKIDSNYGVAENLCKLDEIQSSLSIIEGIDSCLRSLPALLALATFMELLPLVGLRRLMVLSMICSGLGVLNSTILFWFHQPWSTHGALLSFIYDVVGGGENTRVSLIMICIASISPPEDLTKFYNYINGSWVLCAVGGSTIGSILLSDHVWLLNSLSIVCYALAACLAAAIPSQHGRDTCSTEDSQPVLIASEGFDSQESSFYRTGSFHRSDTKRPLIRILLHSWRSSYQSILSLFFLPNPTFTIILVFLVDGLAYRIEILLPQYMSLLLHWPLATVNRAFALKSLVSATVLFMLPTLRDVYLKPRMLTPQIDLFIIQAALLANFVGLIGIGFAAPIIFGIALVIDTAGTGVYDSLTAYGTLTLPPGEKVTDFYVHRGLISTLAALVGGPVWSLIFSYALKSEFLPLGLPFWICAGLVGLGIVAARTLRTSEASGLDEQHYERVVSDEEDESHQMR